MDHDTRCKARLREAELALALERRRAHWLRVLAFLAFVAFSACAFVLSQRPSYAQDHARASLDEVAAVMERHPDPRRRTEAIAVGAALCVRYMDALKRFAPRDATEAATRAAALTKLQEAIR